MRRFICISLAMMVMCLQHGYAAEDDFSALSDMDGRYTLGAWTGAQSGALCQLSNTETLSGGELTFMRPQGQKWLGILLNAPRASGTQAVVQIDDIAQTLPVTAPDSGWLMKWPDGDKAQAALHSGKWLTISLGGQSFRYDLHGINRALPFFSQCLAQKLPADLPYEALTESAPRPIHGAQGWEMISLKDGAYVYEQVASFAATPEQALSLWRYNADQWVLNVSDLRATTTLPQQGCTAVVNSLSWPCHVQQDGVMIPLDATQLQALAGMNKIDLKIGAYEAHFKTGTLAPVIAGF